MSLAAQLVSSHAASSARLGLETPRDEFLVVIRGPHTHLARPEPCDNVLIKDDDPPLSGEAPSELAPAARRANQVPADAELSGGLRLGVRPSHVARIAVSGRPR